MPVWREIFLFSFLLIEVKQPFTKHANMSQQNLFMYICILLAFFCRAAIIIYSVNKIARERLLTDIYFFYLTSFDLNNKACLDHDLRGNDNSKWSSS